MVMVVEGAKPLPWAPVCQGLVAPEWRWAWRELRLVVLNWKGGGIPCEIIEGRIPTVGGGISWAFSPIGLSTLSDGTVNGFVRFATAITATPFTLLLGGLSDGVNTGPLIWMGRSAVGDDYVDLYFTPVLFAAELRNVGGTTISGGTISANRFHVGVLVCRGNQNHELYADGLSVATDLLRAISPADYNRSTLHMMDDLTPFGTQGKIGIALFWARELVDAEILQISLDPFGPFRLAMPILAGILGVAHVKNLADTLTIADSLIKGFGRFDTDTLAIADALAKAVGKPYADTVAIADALVKAIEANKTETLSITDVFATDWPYEVGIIVIAMLYNRGLITQREARSLIAELRDRDITMRREPPYDL